MGESASPRHDQQCAIDKCHETEEAPTVRGSKKLGHESHHGTAGIRDPKQSVYRQLLTDATEYGAKDAIIALL